MTDDKNNRDLDNSKGYYRAAVVLHEKAKKYTEEGERDKAKLLFAGSFYCQSKAKTYLEVGLVFSAQMKGVKIITPDTEDFVPIRSIAFSPDGKILACTIKNNLVKFWDVATGEEMPITLKEDSFIKSIAFSSDGKKLATANGSIWDVATGRKIQSFSTSYYSMECDAIAFSPDGIIAGGTEFYSATIWDSTTGDRIKSLEEDKSWLESYHMHDDCDILDRKLTENVVFNPNGKLLAYILPGFFPIRLRECSDWKIVQTLEFKSEENRYNSFSTITFSPDSAILASNSSDWEILLWDIDTGKVITELIRHGGRVRALAFSPDGKTLVSGADDANVILWDVRSGKELAVLQGHKEEINCVAFSPDGKTIASVSNDDTIILWNTEELPFLYDYPYSIKDMEEFLRRVENESGFRIEDIFPVPITSNEETMRQYLSRILDEHSQEYLEYVLYQNEYDKRLDENKKLVSIKEERKRTGYHLSRSPEPMPDSNGMYLAASEPYIFDHWESGMTFLHRVKYSKSNILKYYEDGHHDGVSNFSFDEYYLVSSLESVRYWDLKSSESIVSLFKSNFYHFHAGFIKSEEEFHKKLFSAMTNEEIEIFLETKEIDPSVIDPYLPKSDILFMKQIFTKGLISVERINKIYKSDLSCKEIYDELKSWLIENGGADEEL